MDEHIDLIISDQTPRVGGVSWPVIFSLAAHVLLILWLIHAYHPVRQNDPAPPIAHFVQIIKQNPQDRNFTEAPGAKVKTAPMTAPFSDANRKASMPKPTGTMPVLRPGDGTNRVYTPKQEGGDGRPAGRPQPQIAQAPQQPGNAAAQAQQPTTAPRDGLTFRQPTQAAASGGPVDLRNAIREVGKVASLGSGRQGLDLGQLGGEKGTAEAGPLSFETQWYDWGEYAESMVSKIRVHWYSEMPMPLLQTGLKGVVTIRFTIHRDGHITDVTIINGSGVAPYDMAAKKAIELASPLRPLPADFPKETEHVTAMFFYNQEPPQR